MFENSDQRYYHVPCPHCGKFQIIKWDRIKFIDRNPQTVYLECSECLGEIYEQHKTKMLEGGKWIAHNSENKIAGFHISGLYSPVGWYSWANAVSDFLAAIGNPNKMKVFVNTVLGEVWEDTATSLDAHYIAKRKEKYSAIVPQGVLVLTAGIDTQDDRLEVTVVGWGLQGESWVIEHNIVYGDPARADTWILLEQYLATQFEHESRGGMGIACKFIDAMGHFTDQVYAFCFKNAHLRVFPCYGKSGAGKSILGSGKKNKRARTYVFPVGVDPAKEMIYARLKMDLKGPGYIHFSDDLDDKYFNGLTSEKRVTRHAQGLPKQQWVLPAGRRNEPLDCMVYAMAALLALNPNLEQLAKENTVFKSDFNERAIPRKSRRVLSRGVE